MKKRLVSWSIITLVVLLISLIGCAPKPPVKPIKIGVIGPMEFIQGEHHWYGAILAEEEINKAGGVLVEEEKRQIKLIKVDSNEILSISDAKEAMEKAITVDKVDFLIGGFEIMAALEMQDIAMDHKKIWLGCGVAVCEMCRRVGRDYQRYKYWFRLGPVNSLNVGEANLLMVEMVGKTMIEELGIKKLKIAVVAEDAPWVDQFGLLEFLEAQVPSGVEIVGIWRPSPVATDLSSELRAIKEAGANIIFFAAMGPVGISFSKQWNELQIPAALLGINLEPMKKGFWEATQGKGEYTLCWNTMARVEITPRTNPFYDKFVKRFDQYPFITACTYDAIYVLKEAIEKAGTLEPDSIVAELEKIDYPGAYGRIKFTERGFYQAGHEIPHDLIWGPGYATTVGTQWQDGELKCVWPWDWEGITYQGTVKYELPPWVIKYWKGRME